MPQSTSALCGLIVVFCSGRGDFVGNNRQIGPEAHSAGAKNPHFRLINVAHLQRKEHEIRYLAALKSQRVSAATGCFGSEINSAGTDMGWPGSSTAGGEGA
jgi:hypothetical protein